MFLRFGHLSSINQFPKKLQRLASTASDRKSTNYQWKIGHFRIQSTTRDLCWSFWWQRWSNNQDQEVFWEKRAVEAVEASKVAEDTEVNEAAEVFKAWKSLLRTAELSRFFSSVIWGLKSLNFDGLKKKIYRIMLNFSTFSVRSCWGQPMLLFWELFNKNQMPKSQKYTDTFFITLKLFSDGSRGLQSISKPVERPCTYLPQNKTDGIGELEVFCSES